VDTLDLFRLDGKVAVVTGARRGIGRAMAQALAEAGADIIGVSSKMEETGSEIEADVLAAGRKFTGYACDFSDRAALYAFIEKLKADFLAIDILVNNAGTTIRRPAAEYTDEIWDKLVEINLNAQFILSREIAKPMINRGRGKIIFIASMMTFQGGINVPGYSAAKGGIGQLTKALANEWASKGIQVNAIAPGYIDTELTQDLQNDPQRSESILGRIPTGHWGKPEDFKGPVVFLASDASNYVNGTILTVDGGWMGR
jgi:2-deoxy-D-gluconate 3-dehydrogenase